MGPIDNKPIGSDNGLAPSRRQAIIWTNDGRLYYNTFTSVGLGVLAHLALTRRLVKNKKDTGCIGVSKGAILEPSCESRSSGHEINPSNVDAGIFQED